METWSKVNDMGNKIKDGYDFLVTVCQLDHIVSETDGESSLYGGVIVRNAFRNSRWDGKIV
jgi:hypothetical protein